MGKREARIKRHQRIRNKVVGTPDRPRMNVTRSLKHIYVQIIDDLSGQTIASASTLDPVLRDEVDVASNKEAAAKVGKLVAQRALEKEIDTVVFDRSGYKYHGRVKALADSAREEGLKF
ncbi:50S ribosomal protein L18 [Halanaerobium sp. Z-7514]|uniref:Large ribosomal subunit protein uL18 n=1 Tax=Halanaerobium polyolivorans TaxID=2886943 RepID=A0AAW4WZ22_9FIRM|nr:50S ribosomal protein L18 [Halanaerobium polyolivorans]MCC3145067.1 50S ribosomal protein L18 [Halanaerobium polyolivorans]RQD79292.1 MAG: 50S ribosomal protein L18 [Halanaerobium sp. MSAO_Bac5]